MNVFMGTARCVLIFFLTLLSLLARSKSFEDELFIKPVVVDLEKVAQSNRMTLLKIFSSMCGTCITFLPEWNKLKKHVGTKLDIIEVDVDKEAGLAFAESIGALEEGLPNLKLFSSHSKEWTTLLKGEGGFANELYRDIVKIAEENGFIDSSGGYVKISSAQPQIIRYLMFVIPTAVLLLICLVPAKHMSIGGNPKRIKIEQIASPKRIKIEQIGRSE